MSVQEITDARFGAIAIERAEDDRTVNVSGEAIPTGSLARTGGARRRGDVPIGTRDPRYLHLEIDGRTYDVRPAAGRLTRRSYRIDIAGHGQSWLFDPAARHGHRLLRGERATAPVELGVFGAGRVAIAAQWAEPSHTGDTSKEPDVITADDCALGYLLSAAFGTGAQALPMAIFQGTVDILIPA